jgi:DNA-binding beta-propeller fold protein YncE
VSSVRVDRNPGDLILSADGRTLYQTHFDLMKVQDAAKSGITDERKMDARLAILDAETMTRKAMVPVCPAPHAVRLSPDEKRAYVACMSDEVAVVRLDTEGYPVTRIKVAQNAGSALAPRHEPYALTVSPTDGSVWVSAMKSRAVHVLDPESLTMRSSSLGLPGAPMFGTFSADGRTLYQPYQGVDAVAVINAATSAVTREIPLAPSGCLNVHQIELTPDGRHGLAVCEGDHQGPGTLHVVDLAAGTVVKTVTLGLFPDSVGILRRKP